MSAKARAWRWRLGGAVLVGTMAGCGNVARGPITALDPFTVGGAVFDARTATVRVDGAPGTLADLGLGMVVTVFAEPARGGGGDVATAIEARSEIKGAVEAVDPAAGTLVVAGVTVTVDAATVFEHLAGLGGIHVGDFVEIHGLPGEGGGLVATRIEVEREDEDRDGDDPADGELKGMVEAADPVAGTLVVAGVTVTVDAGTVFEHASGLADLAVGDRVEVHGLRGENGAFTATRIEREFEDDGDDDHGGDHDGDDDGNDDGDDDDEDHDDDRGGRERD